MTWSAPHPFDAERWCRDVGFVRALAGRLVTDASAADDLAQEAWVQALRGPGPRTGFRGWIAAIVRHAAVSQNRRRRRRAHHETLAAPAALAHDENDPASVTARLEAHAMLVAAVRALDEPYRIAIVLRYFEGLSPGAIATRRGLPVRTVHTHLQRGLARLRAALHERDARWPALLLPVLPLPGAAAALAMTSSTTKSTVCCGLLLALLVGLGWQFVAAGDEPDAPRPPAQPVAAAVTPPTPQRPASEAHRQAVPAPAAADEQPVPEPPAPWLVHGVVLTRDGAPLGGVGIALTPFFATEPAARAASGADGSFAFALPDAIGGNVDVDDPAWTAVYRPVLWGNRDVGELTVVAAPAWSVRGIAVDEAGSPVAGAEISASGTLPMRSGFTRDLERARSGEWTTTSTADGTFVLPRAPRLADLQLHARARGFRHLHTAVDAPQHMRLVLERAPVLHGRVFDEQGRPVEAAVFCYPAGAQSGADGRFELDLSHVSSPWLVAALAGHLPARLRCANDLPNDPASWPQPLELRLAGAPLAITGRALAADGTPIAAPQVTLLDAECLVPGNTMSSIEFLARVHARVTEHGAEFSETGLLGSIGDGGFGIGGLQDRSYRLRLDAADTCQWVETGPIRAGAKGVELHLPAEPMWAAIGGIVVDRRGSAVPRASVWMERMQAAPAGPYSGTAVTTGVDGRFARGPLACAAHTLCVQTEGIAHPTRYDLRSFRDVADLRIAAPVKTKARIVTAVDADTAAFVDAADVPIAATITQGDSAWGAHEVALTSGTSEVVVVPDNAAFLVLRKGGREVARIRVDLQPGPVQTLRP